MKKQLYITSFLTACLCSACQHNEISLYSDSEYPIVFMSEVDVETNTRSNFISQFPEGAQVGMYMFCLAENGQGGTTPWNGKKMNCLPDKDFENKALTYNNGVWSYDNLQYWYEQADYLYSFFAYYPYTANAATNQNAGIRVIANTQSNYVGDPTLSYTMPFSGGSVDGTRLEASQVQDVVYGTNIDRINNGTPVEIHFSHLLSGLEFRVDNYNETSSVTITSLKLKGTFYRTVTTRLSELIKGSEAYSGYFSLISGTSQVFTPNSTQQQVMQDGGENPAELLLICDIASNSINPEGAACQIDITYKVGEGSDMTATMTVPTDEMSFQPGVKNIISLQFLGSQFMLDFRTGDHWTLGGDDDIIFQ